MAEVRIQEEIAAPAQAVWDLLGDFAAVGRWFPGASRVSVEGKGVGAVRTIPMGGSKIRERLEAFDEKARRFEYSIVEAPLPVKNYRATVSVEALGPQRCRVHWLTRFEAVGMPAEQLAPGLEGAYRSGLAAIARLVASRSAGE
jgi:carbon monoxide dehydrogenase subunit G